LLEPGVLFVDYIQPAFAANDLAISAPLFNGGSYLHEIYFLIFIPEIDPSPAQVIRTNFYADPVSWQNTDVVHPHFA
jgi:hypothetical protein